MRNITVAKTKATVFGTTKRKGTPQILPPKSKKASHICNLQTKGLHGFCLHNLLSATTFSSVGIIHQYPVWLAGCGQVNIFKNLFDYTNSFIHTTQQCPQDWKKSVLIPIPKKGNAKECSNYHTIALISHTSKVMLKILQARLQQYVNCELPDVQAGFKKGRGTRDQIANIRWIIKKQENSRKTSISVLLTM